MLWLVKNLSFILSINPKSLNWSKRPPFLPGKERNNLFAMLIAHKESCKSRAEDGGVKKIFPTKACVGNIFGKAIASAVLFLW